MDEPGLRSFDSKARIYLAYRLYERYMNLCRDAARALGMDALMSSASMQVARAAVEQLRIDHRDTINVRRRSGNWDKAETVTLGRVRPILTAFFLLKINPPPLSNPPPPPPFLFLRVGWHRNPGRLARTSSWRQTFARPLPAAATTRWMRCCRTPSTPTSTLPCTSSPLSAPPWPLATARFDLVSPTSVPQQLQSHHITTSTPTIQPGVGAAAGGAASATDTAARLARQHLALRGRPKGQRRHASGEWVGDCHTSMHAQTICVLTYFPTAPLCAL